MKSRTCLYAEQSPADYQKARDVQFRVVAARKQGRIRTDVILLLEHPPVFTLGRRGGLENLMVSEAFLKKLGIPVIHVERGGNITFHGPGQLVGYPIIDLKAARLSVVDYVENLEKVMIRTAEDLGVQAEQNPMNRGAWVGNSKLGSIGIAVRHWICFHGFAFNANISLEPFEWINPCGLRDIGVTSLARELSRDIPMDQVRDVVKGHIEAVFDVDLEKISLKDLLGKL